jgi:hypothetical protein
MRDVKPSEQTFEGYKKGEDVPLFSYGMLAGTFNLLFALFLLVTRISGRSLPERIDARDIVLLGMATHKLSLVGSQDAITSPLRAPFTELEEKKGPKKVEEKPRGEGLRRSVGELLTCQFCLACGWPPSSPTASCSCHASADSWQPSSPRSPSRTSCIRSTKRL